MQKEGFFESLKPIWAKKGRDEGEKEASVFLHKNGYKIIERNYDVKWAEIDIIAKNKKTVSFIEVKRRSGQDFGTPGQAVNYKKQQKIKNAALVYLQKNGIEMDVSFDVIEIYAKKGQKPHIIHIKNAF